MAVPFDSPDTVAVVTDVLNTWVGVWATPLRYGVIVYWLIGLPLLIGAVQLTWACPEAGIADTPVGAPGGTGPVGVIVLDGAEAAPEPVGLEACTVKV